MSTTSIRNFRLSYAPTQVISHTYSIFSLGCFWHVHNCRYGKVKPAINVAFWQNKRQSNKERDKRNLRKLRRLGWKVLIIWECQTRNLGYLIKKLETFLTS